MGWAHQMRGSARLALLSSMAVVGLATMCLAWLSARWKCVRSKSPGIVVESRHWNVHRPVNFPPAPPLWSRGLSYHPLVRCEGPSVAPVSAHGALQLYEPQRWQPKQARSRNFELVFVLQHICSLDRRGAQGTPSHTGAKRRPSRAYSPRRNWGAAETFRTYLQGTWLALLPCGTPGS